MNATSLWSTPPYIGEDPVIPDEVKWNLIRQYRNEFLRVSDWTQLGDAPLTLEEKQSWSAYRQSLRDLPENFANPDEVVFPETPGAE